MSHQRNLIAQDDGGNFVNLKCGTYGELKTKLTDDNLTAFGEISTAQYTPIIQETFMYNVNSAKWDSAVVNSTVEMKNAMASISTTAVAGASGYIQSKKRIKYRAGMGVCVRFTALWTTTEANGAQYLSAVGLGDSAFTDGFFFGRENGVMRIYHNRGGATVNSYAQTTWNVDKADGKTYLPAIDFSKGNVFQIKFQYLGFGQVSFYIENPNTGDFQMVHAIKYANTQTLTTLNNTTLPFTAYIANVGAIVAVQNVKVASVGCFIEGTEIIRGIPFIYERTANATNAVSHVFTMRNNATAAGGALTNYSIVYPRRLNILNTDSKSGVIIKVIKNATLTGAVYVENNTNTSLVSFDTTATVAGGNVIAVEYVNLGDAHSVNLNDYDLDDMLPGDRFTITAQATLNQTISIQYALTWIEDP